MKLLLYCTKAKPYLRDKHNVYGDYHCFPQQVIAANYLNGKIVAECDFEVEEIDYNFYATLFYSTKSLMPNELYRKACIKEEEMEKYLTTKSLIQKNVGYAIHIKNLYIFDIPKELDYYYSRPKKVNTFDWYRSKGYTYTNITLDKAPQNMMYCCTESGREYILISIRPEWLCKILNKEKTVEVRKKVLKEMLNNE